MLCDKLCLKEQTVCSHSQFSFMHKVRWRDRRWGISIFTWERERARVSGFCIDDRHSRHSDQKWLRQKPQDCLALRWSGHWEYPTPRDWWPFDQLRPVSCRGIHNLRENVLFPTGWGLAVSLEGAIGIEDVGFAQLWSRGKSMALQWQQSSLQQHFGYLLPFLALSQPVEDFSQQQDIYRRFKQALNHVQKTWQSTEMLQGDDVALQLKMTQRLSFGSEYVLIKVVGEISSSTCCMLIARALAHFHGLEWTSLEMGIPELPLPSGLVYLEGQRFPQLERKHGPLFGRSCLPWGEANGLLASWRSELQRRLVNEVDWPKVLSSWEKQIKREQMKRFESNWSWHTGYFQWWFNHAVLARPIDHDWITLGLYSVQHLQFFNGSRFWLPNLPANLFPNSVS